MPGNSLRREFDSPLQTAHLCVLKGVLGVRKTTPSWAVLQEPLRNTLVDRSLCSIMIMIIGSALLPSFFNSLLAGSGLHKKIVHADIALTASYKKCWTAEFIEACEGSRASDRYINCFKAAILLPLQDVVMPDHCY